MYLDLLFRMENRFSEHFSVHEHMQCGFAKNNVRRNQEIKFRFMNIYVTHMSRIYDKCRVWLVQNFPNLGIIRSYLRKHLFVSWLKIIKNISYYLKYDIVKNLGHILR